MLSHSALKQLIPALCRHRHFFGNSVDFLSNISPFQISLKSFNSCNNSINSINSNVRTFTSSNTLCQINQLNTSKNESKSFENDFEEEFVSPQRHRNTQLSSRIDSAFDDLDDDLFSRPSVNRNDNQSSNVSWNRDDNFTSKVRRSGFDRNNTIPRSNRQSKSSFHPRKLQEKPLPELGADAAVDPNFTAKQIADANPDDAKLHIDQFDMSLQIKSVLTEKFGIKQFYPIQAECYHPIVSGKDVLGRSRTGGIDSLTSNLAYYCIQFSVRKQYI